MLLTGIPENITPEIVSAEEVNETEDTTSLQTDNSDLEREEEIKIVGNEEHKQLNTTREIVTDYFIDIPVLVDVAYCESGIVQFDVDGSVFRGFANQQDVGVMQINEKYHLETSKKMGLDIYTLEGNLAYGRFLYETQGTRPWEYSSHCWNKTREVALN